MPTTGHIGRVAVLGESSIGSGVRRIDALVGDGAYGFQAKEHALVSQVSGMLGGRPEEIPGRVETLMARLRDAEKKLAAAEQTALAARVADVVAGANRVGKVRLAALSLGEVVSADALRNLTLDARERLGEGEPTVVVVVGVAKERPVVVVATNSAARQQGVKAGALVRVAARVLGGGGGGKDDLAQGGGQDAAALPEALRAVARELEV